MVEWRSESGMMIESASSGWKKMQKNDSTRNSQLDQGPEILSDCTLVTIVTDRG